MVKKIKQKKAKATTPCGRERPEDRKAEQDVKAAPLNLEELADMPISLVTYPGCIEGDRITFSTKGRDRAVLAYGSAADIANYAVGKDVTLGDSVPKTYRGEYSRNVPRKQNEAVSRLLQEMTGEGDVADLVKEKQGRFGGYTLAVNGERVKSDAVISSYFVEMTIIMEGKKPRSIPSADVTEEHTVYKRQGNPIKTMGGVELVVSAIIIPGGYESLDAKL
ncbi:hypothetical protein HN681_00815 [archaeon]|jgi:hypothetical protein|nr:hypothetical protein [archaeon]MBT3730844.1 hypothetical protein [archaeon]MBT4670158.1 hypothetical protein [archaeon]MBT5030552.1 hypothetical protein [archaeon]MBT5287905.1 hypothetical protein [archaeon]